MRAAGEGERLPLEAWGRDLLARLQVWSDRAAWSRYGFEFLMFGLKQGWACLFGGLMLALLMGTHLLWPVLWPAGDAPIARYDFLVLAAVAIQAGMLILKLESWEEARVIASIIYTWPKNGRSRWLQGVVSGHWVRANSGCRAGCIF